MITLVEKAKSMYLSQLKQLRQFYSSNLEDLKKDEDVENVLGNVFDDFTEAFLRSISNQGVDTDVIEKACSNIEVKEFKSSLKSSLIDYYADKIQEIDNLISIG